MALLEWVGLGVLEEVLVDFLEVELAEVGLAGVEALDPVDEGPVVATPPIGAVDWPAI